MIELMQDVMPPPATGPVCAEVRTIAEALRERYAELPAIEWIADHGDAVWTVYLSPAGTVTVTVRRSATPGIACVVATGNSAVDARPRDRGT